MRKPSLSRARGFVLALCPVLMLAGVGLVLPASAGAFATAGAVPVPGSPGLPDGRVYEEVSPADKNGNQAAREEAGEPGEIWAAADGNAAAFDSFGPMGDAPSGQEPYTVARRSAGGWESYGAAPASQVSDGLIESQPHYVGFSADFSKSIFQAPAPFVPGEPGDEGFDGYIYDIGAGPTIWLGEPLSSNPASCEAEDTGSGYSDELARGQITGVSSDLSTVYFSLHGGFCEWHEGLVSDAGVLPDGSLDPYGAVPAGLITSNTAADSLHPDPDDRQNEVSEDGTKAFFVSPAPEGAAPAGDVPELYVRETAADGAQSTVLVSRDTLLPAVDGLSAAAPHGPLAFLSPNSSRDGCRCSYVWATPDGSRAFFLSTDQLTVGAPADESGKLYEFNLETNTLAYLRGAVAPTTEGVPEGAAVLAASRDGSRLLFVKLEPNGYGRVPTELDLWTDGPEGPADGQITPIAPLNIENSPEYFEPDFPYTRAASDGSAFVFETTEAFPGYGFNNGGGRFDQVYRYEVATNSLSCLSCAPVGVTPSGDAQLSSVGSSFGLFFDRDRGISENGDRVFFDTLDPLVPWDTNTAPPIASVNAGNGKSIPRGYDVYEWENGRLFLISTGNSSQNSFVGDNSANGNDVFFSTAEGLVPGDTDGGYDVYDARVPHPGDNPPPSAVPCEGDVCQGPPNVPSLLGAPASATFSGLGNPAAPAPTVKAKQRPEKKAKKKSNKRKRDKKSGSKAKGKG